MNLRASHPFRSARAKAEYQALYMERAKAWPVTSETQLIETPSGQTFVRSSGHLTDPPLILLPGSRGTSCLDGGLTWEEEPEISSIEERGLPIRDCSHVHPNICHQLIKSGRLIPPPCGQRRPVGGVC